jgi:hypothetical protein
MGKSRCDYLYLRSFVISAFLVLATAANAAAGSRLNLPQSSAEVSLNAEGLNSILTRQNGDDEDILAPQITQLLIGSLPREFRDACREMVPNFGPQAVAQTTSEWSVRRLHAEGNDIQHSALLALRCTAHVPNITYYDERPALLLVNKEKALLKLSPLAEDCKDCSDLYHIRFTQKFGAPSGYLAEMSVEHSNENPCCDGIARESGTLLLLVAVPDGTQVLAFEKDSFDDTGEEATECKSSVFYERESDGRLKSITTRTSCTANGKPVPQVTKQFVWNPNEKRFRPRNAA